MHTDPTDSDRQTAETPYDLADGHADLLVIGGGAAAFFAAITLAEARPDLHISIVERGSSFLQKVRISGGGRCNVTHADYDPRAFTARYPRGDRALLGPFHRFQARDTVAWFEARGVELKTEPDGRIFPVTDDSATVVDCLIDTARRAGVRMHLRQSVESLTRVAAASSSPAPAPTDAEPGFLAVTQTGRRYQARRVLLATGGCRTAAAAVLPQGLGHAIEPPVPSLFTLHLDAPWLLELPGVTVDPVVASVPGTKLSERGPLLITHWGVSGPVILRLSAWGARVLHDQDYRGTLHLNWLPDVRPEALEAGFLDQVRLQPTKLIVNTGFPTLPNRLWRALVEQAGIPADTRWANLTKAQRRALVDGLSRTALSIVGKSLNKDEFVTCGGVALKEINFKTMASRVCPGLYLAGEVLDIDGITGGFNFQSAWTTGYLAALALADEL